MPDPTIRKATGAPVIDRTMLAKALDKTALVGGVFCLVLWMVLLGQHFAFKTDDPLKSLRITELKEQLRLAPKDEPLKKQIRELDLRLRQRYFLHLRLNDTGAWLLLGGGILFLVVRSKARDLRNKPYLPQGCRDDLEEARRVTRLARASVAALGVVTVSALSTFAFCVSTNLPRSSGELVKLPSGTTSSVVAVSDVPSREEFNNNWPHFRGPFGNGLSLSTKLPANFEAANLIWKTDVPSAGFNSPIVWGNRIFMSAGDATVREVFCFNTENGELLWRKPAQGPNAKANDISVPEATGYASSSMATDGRRVYAIFANYDLAAFNFDGQQLWSKNFGKPQNQHGHAASLVTWQDRVIVQLDQGHEDDHLSKLYALDGKTGAIVWQRSRPVDESWASPIIVEANGKQQIITAAAPWVIAYAATNGAEIWRFNGLHGEVTSSPSFGGGNVYAISAYENLLAIRPDGSGDVTKTHQAWTSEDNAPDISSPAATHELVFVLSTPGLLTCHDTRTGEKVWEHDFKTEFFASPTIADGRVYLFSTGGTAVVIEAERQFQELARAELNEKISASPALVQNRIFIRGHKHLFCFGNDTGRIAKADSK